ncbi:MAG: DUF1508 domain-containing protein [Acidobacteriota bacterium]
MKPTITFILWKAKDGVRWKAVHRNGRVIAESGESYKRKSACERSLRNFMLNVCEWKYVVLDQTKAVK